jgi:hypothetical protein
MGWPMCKAILAAGLEITVPSWNSGVISILDYQYAFPPVTLVNDLTYQIVSGCLLPLPSAASGGDSESQLTLDLKKPTMINDTERAVFAINLVEDVVSALQGARYSIAIQTVQQTQASTRAPIPVAHQCG